MAGARNTPPTISRQSPAPSSRHFYPSRLPTLNPSPHPAYRSPLPPFPLELLPLLPPPLSTHIPPSSAKHQPPYARTNQSLHRPGYRSIQQASHQATSSKPAIRPASNPSSQPDALIKTVSTAARRYISTFIWQTLISASGRQGWSERTSPQFQPHGQAMQNPYKNTKEIAMFRHG